MLQEKWRNGIYEYGDLDSEMDAAARQTVL